MIATTFTKKIAAPVVETWTRPTDWLPLPDVPSQGLVGLCAVPPEGAYVAILANTNLTVANGGRYIVNWGNGTQDEVNANATFTKVLNYSDYSESSACSRGYRQAIVTITPKPTPSQNLTLLRLVSYTPRPYTTTPWLDIEIKGTTALATLQLTNGSGGPFHTQLERVKIHSLGSVTSLANFFFLCSSLKEVVLPSTSKITAMNGTFNGCGSLLSAPTMDTSAVTTMSSMFQNCYKLKSVPAMNTAKVTSMASMFNGCAQLESAPSMDTAKVTTMASMFIGCVKLANVQASFTTGLCTTLANMFNGCRALKTPPVFTDTSKVTTINSIFNNCTELLFAPELNCSLVTNIYGAFYGCVRLDTLPNYTFPNAITDARLFISFATNLKSIANLIFSSTIGNMGEFANGANSLRAVPALNVTPASNNLAAFNRCYNLADVPDNFILGCKTTTDFRHCSLSAADLNKIFTSLATVLTTQTNRTIYIRGNPGTATCDKTIATNKNWIVDVTTA